MLHRLENVLFSTADVAASVSQKGYDGPENRNHSVSVAVQIDCERGLKTMLSSL